MTKSKKDLERITIIKPFLNKYHWEEKTFSSEKDNWKKSGKNSTCMWKKKKYILLMF